MNNIEQYIQQAIINALNKLSYDSVNVTVKLERPKQEIFGDWALNVAMELAAISKKKSSADCSGYYPTIRD